MSTSYSTTSSYPDAAYSNKIHFTIDNFTKMNLSDGTWTFTDPVGMIATYAYNSGTDFNEIRLNTINPANDSLQPNVNPSQCPRWSKLATYTDGSPVFGSDNFILTITTILKGSTAGTLRRVQHYLGVAESVAQNSDPLNTNKWSGVGQSWGYVNSDADATGGIIQGITATVVSGSANDVKCSGNVSVIGRSAINTVVGLNSSSENENSNANSFSGGLYSASGQLYIIYLFGAFGAGRVYAAGDGTDVSYKYKFTKIINAGL
tara:strand:- start:20502 stop:21287 length:786 start_codon:yes stop_codon:yes gene_type:complete